MSGSDHPGSGTSPTAVLDTGVTDQLPTPITPSDRRLTNAVRDDVDPVTEQENIENECKLD